MFDKNQKVLLEDAAPSDALSPQVGAADPLADPKKDPTAGAEFDTSPEALDALRAQEASNDLTVESVPLPKVQWSPDRDQPDYAHARNKITDDLLSSNEVVVTPAVFDLLIRANRFVPRGTNGLLAFGLRGGRLIGDDRQEGVARFTVTDSRPDHVGFNCTLGIIDTNSKTLSAFTGSTVPNVKWMQNYYKLQNGISTNSKTRSNLLPTGCYIYRVNAHGGGKIKPALRMTNPDNLTEDAVCTVLRTSNDLAYAHDDLWDRSTPYDNIHCAYFETSFSSAGCQTIKGANGQGAWGAFQNVIGALGWNARIDYLLFTARDAALAAAILEAGRQDDAGLVENCLGRLRVGSEGPIVTALQKKLGFKGSGYFGPSTKRRLTQIENSSGIASDGIYSPADDQITGWQIFGDIPAPSSEDTKADALYLSLSAEPSGPVLAEVQGSEVVFKSASDQQKLKFDAGLNLASNGAEFPLTLHAKLTGAHAKDVAFELVLRARSNPPPSPAITSTDTGITPPAISPATSLTAAQFDAFAPNARSDYRDEIVANAVPLLADFGLLQSPLRLAHFLAQLSHESGGFRLRTENLTYTTAQRLTEVWPSRFPTLAAAKPFMRNEEALANEVYHKRLGNTAPGDGFKYRGRGMIQLTGKANYQEFSDRLGLDLIANPDLAFDPTIALRIAAEFWASRKWSGERAMNELADDDKLRAITYRINGGFIGLEHREADLARAKIIFASEAGPASASDVTDRGDFDDMVRRLQLLLIEQGVLRGKVDGKFGRGTYRGLFEFKTAARLANPGYADPATFAALRAADLPLADTIEAIDNIPSISDEAEPVRNGINMPNEGEALS